MAGTAAASTSSQAGTLHRSLLGLLLTHHVPTYQEVEVADQLILAYKGCCQAQLAVSLHDGNHLHTVMTTEQP
jgi:hypothetical protein